MEEDGEDDEEEEEDEGREDFGGPVEVEDEEEVGEEGSVGKDALSGRTSPVTFTTLSIVSPFETEALKLAFVPILPASISFSPACICPNFRRKDAESSDHDEDEAHLGSGADVVLNTHG